MSGYRSDTRRLHARALRAAVTPAEVALWQALRGHRFRGFPVRRRAPVGPRTVDFVIPSCRLVNELLDESHDRATDRAPAADLIRPGYRVIHLPPEDVMEDLPATLRRLAKEIGA